MIDSRESQEDQCFQDDHLYQERPERRYKGLCDFHCAAINNYYDYDKSMQRTVGPSDPGCPGGPSGPGSPYTMKDFMLHNSFQCMFMRQLLLCVVQTRLYLCSYYSIINISCY